MKVKLLIKSGLRKEIDKYIKGRKCCIITDSNVYKKYEKDFGDLPIIVKPAGESIKSLKNLEATAEKLVNLSLDRNSLLIALGGGTIGDFTGFLASTYMRGIPFIQLPTTLLAMIDSSIGGKTGVNLKSGKNLIGTFHQPEITLIDPDFLKTLPRKELLNGLAETIKHACIKDEKLFEFLKRNHKKILAKDPAILNKLIVQSSKVKIDIVKKDEKESGLRMLLNYGHTIGHAIEKASNYKLSHGEAVSIGMHQVNLLTNFKGTKKVENLLKLFKLPTQIPTYINKTKVKKLIANDKKSGQWIVLEKIGKAKVTKDVTYS